MNKIIKRIVNKMICVLAPVLPNDLFDLFQPCFPQWIDADRLERDRIRRYGLKLVKNSEHEYKKILSGKKIMIIEEGDYPFTYLNTCYLRNMINLILYALYKGCVPVIKINDDKESDNKWNWYFRQPIEVMGGRWMDFPAH